MSPAWSAGSLNEVGALEDVLVSPAAEAFLDPVRVAAEWQSLNYTAEPHLDRALDEYESFLEILAATGATVRVLERSSDVGMDSLYARDASVLTPDGVVLCRMGKAARAGEPGAQGRAYAAWGIPVIGEIVPPGKLEGGDLVWLDEMTVAVGQGYRTNADGIEQFRAFLSREVECISVPLPHWRGPSDVFHLMSILSPIDQDLLVVYSPLMPVPFRERLAERGYAFVEVPDSEWESMGTNVLALAPRKALMLDGNPVTKARLEAAGAEVVVFSGNEISVKGGGGPTCLTRPLRRRAVASVR
jgi:N-dimethylarginine dimethylaminohydrolase